MAGLDEELRTLDRENLRDRHEAYQRSRLSLTEFGKAIVAHKEDFSRHNPIDRWWGGTHLTNDHLWRWNPTLMKPCKQPETRAMTRLILTANVFECGRRLYRPVLPIWLSRSSVGCVWGRRVRCGTGGVFVSQRRASRPGSHWLDSMQPQRLEKFGVNGLGLIELCERFEAIELWIDPEPNAQLLLIWLLDYLGRTRNHAQH